MLDRTPHIFISYSWTTEDFQTRVKELAERLMHDGVDVRLDIWDLKDGQDKYAFMEQCVTDPEIDRVLIICDKGYAEKADHRQGGVGDETTIISPEIYRNAKQEKFIPVIMERDEAGEPYVPAYLKSRMYKDLSGEHFEDGYESLLRTIFEQPSVRKPEIGKPPAWLTEQESSTLYPLKEAERHVSLAQLEKKKTAAAQDFMDAYIDALKPFFRQKYQNDQEYLDDFAAMKEYRNVFLDFLKEISGMEHMGEYLADVFERMYNELYCIQTFIPGARGCGYDEFDIFRLHIWELFICTVTYLLHIDAYSEINELLVHTYFLKTSPLTDEMRAVNYEAFRFHSERLENRIKPNHPEEQMRRKYTLAGYLLCTEREYLPIYTGRKMAEADLFLYQVYSGLPAPVVSLSEYSWFPTCYVYAPEGESMWKKLISRRFCEKIMPLFGVSTIEELKERISKCTLDRNYRYSSGFAYPAPAILSYVRLEDVAMYP